MTVIKDGYFGDNSKMYVVGETNIRSQKLVEAAQEALYVGLRTVKPGIRLNEIGKAVQKYTESQGFSVVREYCGQAWELNSTVNRKFYTIMLMTVV